MPFLPVPPSPHPNPPTSLLILMKAGAGVMHGIGGCPSRRVSIWWLDFSSRLTSLQFNPANSRSKLIFDYFL